MLSHARLQKWLGSVRQHHVFIMIKPSPHLAWLGYNGFNLGNFKLLDK